MLSYILGLAQAFKRQHGYQPQLVSLNYQHLSALQNECPDLDQRDLLCKLGFRLALIAESELPHPKVAWLPPIGLRLAIIRESLLKKTA